jgi:hypothetical protein
MYARERNLVQAPSSAHKNLSISVQGDTHRFRQDTPFRAKNILRTIIDRTGIADPTLVTVDLTQDNPFIFERHELSGM